MSLKPLLWVFAAVAMLAAHPAAGRDAGLKLMEIKRLREKGHRITLLNETRFWRLVSRR